jgi:site-specific recombinase XerD
MKLTVAVDRYLAHKRSTGLKYNEAAKQFRRLRRRLGDIELADVTTHHLERYLGMPPSGNSASWHGLYLRLEKFFNYWILRGERPPLTMPVRPKRKYQRRSAYIYSQAEIRKLLEATDQCQARDSCRVDGETLRMFLILLYATGAMVYELLDLRRDAVSFKNRSIVVYNRRHGRHRTVPIGRDLRGLLGDYLKSRPKTEALFADKRGRPIDPGQVTFRFGRLRRLAGVGPRGPAPRLSDFRTTFAVHRVQAWIKEGANLNRMLPALAVYMGQARLASIDKYLDLTPERFASHIAILSPDRPPHKTVEETICVTRPMRSCVNVRAANR